MTVSRGAIALVAFLAVAPAASAAGWSASYAVPPGSAAAASVQSFAAALARDTAGAVAVSPAAAAPADGVKVAGAVAGGKTALGAFPLSVLEGDAPALGIARVPFLATSFVDAGKLWKVLRAETERVLAARGMVLLYAVPSPPAAPIARRPLASIDAWRGAKMLVDDPALGPLARFLGAQPVAASSAREVLAAGKADIAFETVDGAARGKAWEYATHYLHAPAWFPIHVVAASRAAVAALDAGARDALLRAADRAGADAWVQAQASTESAVQKLRDYGIKTLEPPVNMLIRLEALGREMLLLWSEGAGESGAETVERYYDLR